MSSLLQPARSIAESALAPVACPAREGDYSALLPRVAAQLADDLPRHVDVLVLIPTVGFGSQSHDVLPRTLRMLAAQTHPGTVGVALLVNRPAHRDDDGTLGLVRCTLAGLPVGPVRFAAAGVVVDGRPHLGALRQLLLDAALAGLQTSPPIVVVADDDITTAPRDYLARLTAALAGAPRCDASLGPVLFDDPHAPSSRFVDFFVADALRALLSARWVARLQSSAGHDPGVPADNPWRRHTETIALSSNLALRTRALVDAGGFPAFNEITGVVQAVQRHAAARQAQPAVGVAGAWNFDPSRDDVLEALLERAVRLSSRRALRAYLRAGVPPVRQWRACRFHASRVDPTRTPTRHDVPPPIDRRDRAGIARVVASAESLIATTLGHFPADRGPALDALRALGLDPSRCTVQPPAHANESWRVAIHDSSVLIERVRRAQAHDNAVNAGTGQ